MIINRISGMLISPLPDLLPDLFCFMVRIFLLMLVLLYIYNTNIPQIMFINRIYENQILLSLQLVSFLIGLRIYQHPCMNLALLYFKFMANVTLFPM